VCGRVVAATPRDVLAAHFSVDSVVGDELAFSYNAAPGASLYTVAESRSRETGSRRLGAMRWGLVPWWAEDPGRGPRPINARAETVFSKRIFADAVERGHRCIVAVSGFFEWDRRRAEDGTPTVAGRRGAKQPYLLTAPDGFPLAMAGLWSRRSRDGEEPLVTVAIVTTHANADVAPLHDRMPVLLHGDDLDVWLDRDTRDPARLASLLQPAPAGSLVACPVDRRVNDARNDFEELLAPLRA